MKLKIKTTAILILLGISFVKISAQECNCDAALAKDKIEYSDEGFESLYYLDELEESEYNEIKRSVGLSRKFKLVKESANFSDFKKRVSNEIKRTILETRKQYKKSYYESRTNPIAYEAWSRCMEICAKGLTLWLTHEDDDKISLKLKYNPPPNSSGINYVIEIRHADNSPEEKRGKIGLNETQIFSIDRKCGSKNGSTTTLISVNGGGYADQRKSVYYCGFKTVPPPCEPREKTVTLSETQNCIEGDCQGIENIEKIEFLRCKLGIRPKEYNGEVCSKDDPKTAHHLGNLKFGSWINAECNEQGNGWYLPNVSSCGTGRGDGIGDVIEVVAKVTYLKCE